VDLTTISEIVFPDPHDRGIEWREGDAWLAGGTWLFSEPQPHIQRLIDLRAFGWAPLTITEKGLEIAATCEVVKLDALKTPAEWIASPLIRQCCRSLLASFKIWNTATVGGNICMSLPASALISLATALEAVCTIISRDGSHRPVPI
jgi:CO/xanthine dehydrogenase FAD-binding subunit